MILIALVVLAVPAIAQSNRNPITGRSTIYVGTELRLGMPRDAVLARITANNYRVVKMQYDGDDWMVQEKSDSPVVSSIGFLGFTNGKLTYASRDWTQGDEDAYEFAEALRGAMKQMEDDGQHSCFFDTPRSLSPRVEMNSLRFYCGSKHVDITSSDISTGVAQGRHVQINEVLSSESLR